MTQDTTTAPPAGGLEDLVSFRQRVRAFLAAHAEPASSTGADDAEGIVVAKTFQAQLFDAKLAGLSWPQQFGGQGLTMDHQLVFNEEAENYVIPTSPFIIGLGMCAPTLLELGTQAQRDRHVARMLRGDEVWCQLFSEPGAGSDVASLRTRAVRDGDDWVVNGQKVWTSGAHHSDFGLLLARTNVDAPKHLGISMFVLDMRSPGVSIRPLRQMNGGSHFNEVFLDDVRISASALVGEVDRGWQAAVATLMNERVSIGAGGGGLGSRAGGAGFTDLLDLARAHDRLDDPFLRQKLSTVFIEEEVLEWVSQQIRADVKSGRAPGPEGSIAKLVSTRLSRTTTDVAAEILGEGIGAWAADDSEEARWADELLGSPGRSIAGGTPEIMRNILGERVLGLPKEPQVDRNLPFKDLKK